MTAPDPGLTHEALHTVSLLADLFDRHVLTSPVIQQDADLNKQAQVLSGQLGALYQAIGRIS